MDLEEFQALALMMWERFPPGFKEGVSAVVITEEPMFDPDLPEVMLMGECAVDEAIAAVPDAPLCSIISLHYGSFAACAESDPLFPWEDELWETLTHELRHHLEWCAGVDHLGDEDDALREELFARARDLDPDVA